MTSITPIHHALRDVDTGTGDDVTVRIVATVADSYGVPEQILVRLTEQAKTRYVSDCCLILISLGLGEKEDALEALERAWNEGAGNDVYCIRVDPMLDELRKDARFEAPAEKVIPAREFKGTRTAR